MKKLLTLLIIASSISACSSMSKDDHKNSSEVTKDSAANNDMNANPNNINESNVNIANSQQTNIITPNSVYFATNQYNIEDKYISLVDANATYLSQHPNAKIKVAGHTDEIGSQEYNLALGQRRAQSIKNYLVAKGVADNQIETISYGKLQPTYPVKDGYLNRRADINYTNEAPSGYNYSNVRGPVVNGDFYLPADANNSVANTNNQDQQHMLETEVNQTSTYYTKSTSPQ